MRKQIKHRDWILIIFFLFLLYHCGIQRNNIIKVAVITTDRTNKKELQSIENYFNKYESLSFKIWNINDSGLILSNLRDFDILWYQQLDTNNIDPALANEQTVNTIKQYIKNGGNLFLTTDAVRYLYIMGQESRPPEVSYAKAVDYGYGRKRGLHSYKYHPVFKGLNGGTFLFSPLQDTTVRQTGYFSKDDSINGLVVAVDWAYIRLYENKKLMLEYNLGKGKILAAGTYLQLSMPNKHRQQLEKVLNNIMEYLAGENETQKYYWYQGINTTEEKDFKLKGITAKPSKDRPEFKSSIKFEHTPDDNFWDLAGQRMLIMGKENSGIDEIWAHPFMALRNYKTGYRSNKSNNITWLTKAEKIIIQPHAITRIYKTGDNNILRETITVDKTKPVAVVHYDYQGNDSIELFINYKSNLRLMWPYSSKVTGKIFYNIDNDLNACIYSDLSGDLTAITGSNKKPVSFQAGAYLSTDNNSAELTGKYHDTLLLNCLMQYELKSSNKFDIVIAATNEGTEQTYNHYKSCIQQPEKIYQRSFAYYEDFLNKCLIIKTPDTVFNESYLWALIATDRFMVYTPGIGTSLVAGYATTASGWDGGHIINGRPGYAWYFGRDAQWSGFAVDDYGDFESVGKVLETFIKYQDLSGKIYHEMSTSGVIHYDAADATPLFIVLAGHYLRHSGDVSWTKQNWEAIQKALEFCFSTDSNNDNLIENTGVGHGWVEGGHLFGGISTLYLSGCWAAALKEAAYMAEVIGNDSLAEKYLNEYNIVTSIINDKFWNEETGFLNHSLNEDGTFIEDITIMPAIPLYFSQVDYDKAIAMLKAFNYNTFSADWGVRIVNKENERYNPGGYHTGSVWPLYTGWTALAEFKNDRPVQGFSHTMNNLLVYNDWSSGFIEEVLHGEVYKPFGVCPHQCWSETMAIQPLIEGMLGYEPDAVNNSLILSPYFPVQWNETDIKNIRLDDQYIDITYKCTEPNLIYTFSKKTDKTIEIDFKPILPAGTKVHAVFINNKKYPFSVVKNGEYTIPGLLFNLKNHTVITIPYSGGIGVVPPVYNNQPGDTSSGLRIISTNLDETNKTYTVITEAPAGTKRSFSLWINDREIEHIDGGKLSQKSDKIYTIDVFFDNGGKDGFICETTVVRLSR